LRSPTRNVSPGIVAMNIQSHYYNLDDPKPDQLHVPESSIVADDSDPAYLNASLQYVTYVNGSRKKHSSKVRFKVDSVNNVITETCSYVA